MKDNRPVAFEVTIRDTKTGEEAVHREEGHEFHDYQWREGNYECDCNRALFFARALGRLGPFSLDYDHPCGSSRYVVTRVVSVLHEGSDLR